MALSVRELYSAW